MSAGWIFLAIIVFVILSKLFSVLGKENVPSEKFRGVLPGTGQVFEMTIVKSPSTETPKKENAFDEKDFIIGAKIAFNTIAEAFAQGNKDALKPLLSRKVFDSFCKEIENRNEKKEKMEFSLISINSSKILSKNNEKKPTKITVELISEQMNVLRDENGTVLEGDPIQLSSVKDTWTCQKTNSLRSTWIVVSTQSEAV